MPSQFSDLDLSVDTTISAGVTLRASDRDCTKISPINGGCANGDGRTTGVNSDNGNLNFDQGDFVNQTVKATVDTQGTWENYGFFLRPTAFYDVVYADNDLDFRNLDSEGKDQLDYDIDILDAFVYGNWDIDGHYTMLRFGKQALNWGESLFIQGGVNAFQALDVTRIRTPGAELKDALTPMPMIFASTMVTPNFSVEAFWQFAYEETELDPAGSFFSPDMPFGVSDLEQNASQLWGTSDPIPEFLGSDTAVFVVNAGFVYVQGASNHPLNRVGPEGAIRNPFAAALLTNGVTNAEYADDVSYGYRLVFAPAYNNAFGTPVTLTPSISWRHDLQRNSPGPNTANYLQGMKQVSIGIDADYQSTYRASLSYTNIFGAGFNNPTFDRDFVMASVSYAF